jgi:Arc/MetJ-type ribon-helix-helix transcriptional regulator
MPNVTTSGSSPSSLGGGLIPICSGYGPPVVNPREFVPRAPLRDTTPIRPPTDSRSMTEYTTVSIPKELADRVEETIEGTSFSSTSDLVRFLLRSIVVQHQRSGELTEAEFAEIADQLRDLGYLK